MNFRAIGIGLHSRDSHTLKCSHSAMGQQWTTMDSNGQQSAVLHASVMPFLSNVSNSYHKFTPPPDIIIIRVIIMYVMIKMIVEIANENKRKIKKMTRCHPGSKCNKWNKWSKGNKCNKCNKCIVQVANATNAVANVDDYSGSARLLAATTLRWKYLFLKCV